jgi:hypothetical protein
VQRRHVFADGHTAELLDLGFILNDEIRKNIGVVSVGDVRDFTLNIQIPAASGALPDSPLSR